MLLNRLNGLATSVICALMLADGAFYAAAWFARSYRHGGPGESLGLLWYLVAILLGFFYASRRLYKFRAEITQLNLTDRIGLSFRILVGLVLGSSLIMFLAPTADRARHFILEFDLAATFGNAVLLSYLPAWMARNFFPEHSQFLATLVGDGPLPESLRAYLLRSNRIGLRISGYFSDCYSPGLIWPYAGNVNEFFRRAETWEAEVVGEKPAEPPAGKPDRHRPDCVLAYNFDHSSVPFQRLVEVCQRRGIRLQAYARLTNNFVEPVQLVAEGDLNFLVFMNEPLEDPVNRLFKRALDFLVAVPVAVLVLPPLVLWVAFMQRRQAPGPLFYRQDRYGANRKPFRIYKFRTMRVAEPGAGEAFAQASKNDSRIYEFGRFLRRTSLDEMPQFLNVLRGEMSVVGPRPHPLVLDQAMQHLLPTYRARHYVLPGITGYAQVLGLRGETSDLSKMVERVRKDIQYVRSWTLGLDLKIILQTIVQIFRPPDSAY